MTRPRPALATWRVVLAVLVAALLGSCASLNVPEPARRPAWPAPETPPSTLVVPVRVPLAAAREWAESLVPLTLTGQDSGQRTLEAWFLKHDWHYGWSYQLRRSPLALGWGSGLRVTAQVTGDVRAWWDTVPGEATAQVAAEVGVEADLKVKPDWTVASRSRVSVQVTKADVPIGITWNGSFFGQNVSLVGPVQSALRPSLEALGQKLDGLLAVSLKPEVEAAWAQLGRPTAVASGWWLSLNPRALALGRLSLVDGTLVLPVALTVSPILGPQATATSVALPDAQASASDELWTVKVPVTMSWDEAAAAAQSAWPDQEFKLDNGARLHLRSMRAFTDADRVLVRVEADAFAPWGGPPLRAVLWLGARPVWNTASRTLSLVEPSLEVRTHDILSQSAAWLLEPSWLEQLRQQLVWSLGSQVDQVKVQATQALSRVDLGPQLRLSTTLDALEVESLSLTDAGPCVTVTLRGRAQVEWRPESEVSVLPRPDSSR